MYIHTYIQSDSEDDSDEEEEEVDDEMEEEVGGEDEEAGMLIYIKSIYLSVHVCICIYVCM